MKIFYTLAVKLAALMLSVSAAGAVYSIDADWRFTKAPVTIPLAQAKSSFETAGVKVEDPAFDDSAWEAVSVPHPINAHDSFDDRAVDAGEASFWRGMAFYRKRFALDAAPKGKAFVTFETVRQSVYLWANGKFAGYYEAGIAPCAFDVTALLKAGETDAAKASAEQLMEYYPKGFAEMVAAFRSKLGLDARVPVVVGEIGRWKRTDGDHYTDLLFTVDTKKMKEGCLLAIVRRTGEGEIVVSAKDEKSGQSTVAAIAP